MAPPLIPILSQPNDETCGPTCLHAVYAALGDHVPLDELVEETPSLPDGGTLLALLGTHALKRGYEASIVTLNLHVFDPSWFDGGKPADPEHIVRKLQAQAEAKHDAKLRLATAAYLEYFERGGALRYRHIGPELLASLLAGGQPVIAGLNATFLHGWPRERHGKTDDVGGEPVGHFVVLSDFRTDPDDPHKGTVAVSDPYGDRDPSVPKYYRMSILRLAFALALGVLTYDANMLVIRRREGASGS